MWWLAWLIVGCAPVDDGDGVSRGGVRFGFPLPERERFREVIGVDHDPVVQQGTLGRAICTNFDGEPFPACYDEHDGTDYILDGSFDAMDEGSSPIVAAATGIVIGAHDGEYDRCHASLEEGDVSCDGNPVRANYVQLQHDDGTESWYWHMKTDSVLVQEGEVVHCGEPLGLVGSSGRSSFPHLHFEVVHPDGTAVDPYAGPESQPQTWWHEQRGDDGLPEPGCAAW